MNNSDGISKKWPSNVDPSIAQYNSLTQIIKKNMNTQENMELESQYSEFVHKTIRSGITSQKLGVDSDGKFSMFSMKEPSHAPSDNNSYKPQSDHNVSFRREFSFQNRDPVRSSYDTISDKQQIQQSVEYQKIVEGKKIILSIPLTDGINRYNAFQ